MTVNNIGRNIAEQRHLLKRTQEQLAEQSGLTSHYLSKLERGVMSNVSALTLYRISKVLNIPMEELVTGESDEHVAVSAEQYRLEYELSRLDLQTNKEYSELFLHILKLKSIKL